jgi:hypothetical protein
MLFCKLLKNNSFLLGKIVHNLRVTKNVSGKKNYEDLLGFNNLSASMRQYFFKKIFLALSAIFYKSYGP